MEQRVVQAPAAVAASEVDAEHFLRQHPAVLAVDLDASALVEHRLVVAVVFKKLHVHRPLPIRLEVLDVYARVGVPEVIGVGHQREHGKRPTRQRGIEKVTVRHHGSGDTISFEHPSTQKGRRTNYQGIGVEFILEGGFPAVGGEANFARKRRQLHRLCLAVEPAFRREIRYAVRNAFEGNCGVVAAPDGRRIEPAPFRRCVGGAPVTDVR